MRTLEQQINWLSNHITYLQFTKRFWLGGWGLQLGITPTEAVNEIDNQVEKHEECLESLLILFERETTCDTCVNNYFDQITTEK